MTPIPWLNTLMEDGTEVCALMPVLVATVLNTFSPRMWKDMVIVRVSLRKHTRV